MWLLQDAIYQIFRGSTWYDAHQPGTAPPPAEAAAQYLATTAAVALMVADVLPAGTLTLMYAPFRDTIRMADLALRSPSTGSPVRDDAPRSAMRRADRPDDRRDDPTRWH
jgi:hypothetical protein